MDEEWSMLTAMAPAGEKGGSVGPLLSQPFQPAAVLCNLRPGVAAAAYQEVWYSLKIETPREDEGQCTAIISNIQL